MELTEIRGSLFGYKKSDVIRYINELNDLHSATVDNKEFEYNTLKDETDAVIKNLQDNTDIQKNSIEELTAQIESVTAELTATVASLNEYKELYENICAETEELRNKSEFISTAIINAEKCAGILVDEARQNADVIMHQAQEKVDLETQRLLKAKGCVSDIRAQLANVMLQINSALGSAENDIDVKIKSVDRLENVNK